MGSGKEVLLQLLEDSRCRPGQRHTISINKSNLDSVRSEIFGHIKGSYTGADRDRVGGIETAGNGTLVIDNAQYCYPDFQALLLRTLEPKREYQKKGSDDVMHAKCRFVVVFNVDLNVLIDKGALLPDWPERFPVKIHLPSLDERKSDIPLLVHHFVRIATAYHNLPVEVQDEAYPTSQQIADWKSQSWDGAAGNVRGLKNAVEACLSKNRGLRSRRVAPKLPANPSVLLEETIRRVSPLAALGQVPSEFWVDPPDRKKGTKPRLAILTILKGLATAIEDSKTLSEFSSRVDLDGESVIRKLDRYKRAHPILKPFVHNFKSRLAAWST